MITRFPAADWQAVAGTEIAHGGSAWSIQNFGLDHSLQQCPQYPAMLRFEVRSGDLYDVSHPTSERSELDERGRTFAFGRDVWRAYDIFIAEGEPTTSSFLVLGQYHASEDVGDAALSPPCATTYIAGDLLLSLRTSSNPVQTGNPAPTLLTIAADIERGRWHRIVECINFDWTVGGTGRARVWFDGDLTVDSAQPIGYNDLVGPYFKFGIYRYASPETLIVIFNKLQVGYSDLSSLIGPAPRLPSAALLGLA